jgi:SAM-dependent methyltransferase
VIDETQHTGRWPEAFVPRGAHASWPFVVGTREAFRDPPWNARLLLAWGVAEAWLGLQSSDLREHWRQLPREYLATFLHGPGVGIDHPSRAFLASCIRAGESVLDVGCGPGVNYEVLLAHGRASHYVGVDSSEPSIALAQERYPGATFRVCNALALASEFGPHSVDVVLVRHVLEHLPDFEAAMDQTIAVSRRLALFVFFLSPRRLPLGVRKVNVRLNRLFYTYVYSRDAIETFLRREGLHRRWTVPVGVSRAGWLAGEVNTVLEVSRTPLETPGTAPLG